MIAITPDECEFYTPPHILEKVYNVFDIDLDPCCPLNSKPVVAKQYFTKEDDGLSKDWHGILIGDTHISLSHLANISHLWNIRERTKLENYYDIYRITN